MPGPDSTRHPSARRWRISRRLLLGLAGLIALVVAGGAWLFGGGDVQCTEETAGGGPAIRCRFEVAAAPATVFESFTGTEKPRPYYFDAILQAELEPGGRWRFVTDDRQRLLAFGEVLAVDPPRRFEHTFIAADLDDPPSRITVEIEPTPAGSRVTLLHDRFVERTVTYRRFRKAHPLALSALAAYLEDGRLPLRARVYTALFKPGMKTFTERAEPWE